MVPYPALMTCIGSPARKWSMTQTQTKHAHMRTEYDAMPCRRVHLSTACKYWYAHASAESAHAHSRPDNAQIPVGQCAAQLSSQ